MPKTKKIKIDESHSSKDLSTKTTTSQDTKVGVMNLKSGDFKDIRSKQAFVDKTMLLEKIMQDNYQAVCLTAPRRFGKSVNLSMIKRFLEVLPDKRAMTENRKLFKKTKIENDCRDFVKEHCGKYPIIFLNFQCSIDDVTCYGWVLERLRTVVHNAYVEHAYLESSDKLNESQKKYVKKWCDDNTFESLPISPPEKIKRALENLAIYLVKHYSNNEKKKKVIVLVDEYDCICSYAIMRIENIKEDKPLPAGRNAHKATTEINDIIGLCLGAIARLLKGNENVIRGVLTGISYLTTIGLSVLNNVSTYRFQEEHVFTQFYGITEDELQQVLKNVNMYSKDIFNKIKKNYNSFRGNMLCTYSVMRYLNDRENNVGEDYWSMSGVAVGLSEAFRIPEVRSIVSYLLSDLSNKQKMQYLRRIKPSGIVNLKNLLSSSTGKHDVNVFLNFLLEQGYLKSHQSIFVDETKKVGQITIEVQIPNLEIQCELSETLGEFYSLNFKLNLTLAEDCAALFDKFGEKEVDNKELLKKVDNKKLWKEIKVILKDIKDRLDQIIKPVEFENPNEASLHHIMFFILHQYSKKFKCFTELTVGNEKRLDLLLLPKVLPGIGVIIELKYNGRAREGLKQIIDKRYYEAFDKRIPTEPKIEYSVFIGLNMSQLQEINLSTQLNCKPEQCKKVNNKCFDC